MTLKTGLNYCCRHLRFDAERHKAAWGARLIYAEVMRGGTGVVYDRQSNAGNPEDVSALFPAIEKWTAEFRKDPLRSMSEGTFTILHDGVMVTGSPQASGGYLYVTAVSMKEADDDQAEAGRTGEG